MHTIQRLFVMAVMALAAHFVTACGGAGTAVAERPNILILMSDNHSSEHVGSYGDPVVRTPNIDQVAEQGVSFANAFASAPSCTPARASMLTGQDIWRLEEGANLHGILPGKFEVYPDLLEDAGYLVGYEGKGWGPGNWKDAGRSRNPAGDKYRSFEEFYARYVDGREVTVSVGTHVRLPRQMPFDFP